MQYVLCLTWHPQGLSMLLHMACVFPVVFFLLPQWLHCLLHGVGFYHFLFFDFIHFLIKNNKNLIVLWCLLVPLAFLPNALWEWLYRVPLSLLRLSWGLLDHHLSEILAASICGSQWGWPVATQLWRRDGAMGCLCSPFLHTAEIRPQSRV